MFALIPQPLLPEQEKGGKNGCLPSPSPILGEGERVGLTPMTVTITAITILKLP
jgi:hypothetical protein